VLTEDNKDEEEDDTGDVDIEVIGEFEGVMKK